MTPRKPGLRPPCDPDFEPVVLAWRDYLDRARASGGVPLRLAVEREDGLVSVFDTVSPRKDDDPESTYRIVERAVKFLLWSRGGWRIHVQGPAALGRRLKADYAETGARAFDVRTMSRVYERPFEVVLHSPATFPEARESLHFPGGYLDGFRIGFDLGASDYKVAAVVDGQPVYSEEVVWEPRIQTNPDYHYREIITALKAAASKMPRVDAIGGSLAGIYVNNRAMIASLFRGIPKDRFGEIKDLFLRIQKEMGVPLEIINDGDVTGLAGSMSLEDNGILGIALGSSEAAGYVDMNGHIVSWLSELAFAPIDYRPNGPLDEWSGDIGCGSQYFSQQCVFRLAPRADLTIPRDVTDAEKLKFVQEKLEAGHAGALQIWQSMGCFMGYGVAHYADFYDIRHVLILGRCTSGRGGQIILDGANEVLQTEFPKLAAIIHLQLPDEKSRRVGQSIAAASLPQTRR